MFDGFSNEAIGFLKELKVNNNRDWFAENKKVYGREIKVPAKMFCEEMCVPAR